MVVVVWLGYVVYEREKGGKRSWSNSEMTFSVACTHSFTFYACRSQGCTNVYDISPLAGCTALENLDLSECAALSDLNGVSPVRLRRLCEIKLCDCIALRDISELLRLDGGGSDIATMCISLCRVDIKGCRYIAAATAIVLVSFFKTLSFCLGAWLRMLESASRLVFLS